MNTTWKKAILASAKLLAVGLVLGIAGCSLFPVSIEARLGDFFDDLESADSDSDYGDLVDLHIHPNTESFSNAKSSGIWESNFLDSGRAEYSWSIQDESDSSEFSGSKRVVVSIDVEVSGSGTSNYPDAVFYMKQDDSDWKIRAIYEDPDKENADDPLLESIVDPTASPVRE